MSLESMTKAQLIAHIYALRTKAQKAERPEMQALITRLEAEAVSISDLSNDFEVEPRTISAWLHKLRRRGMNVVTLSDGKKRIMPPGTV